jgi:hypothetical protein
LACRARPFGIDELEFPSEEVEKDDLGGQSAELSGSSFQLLFGQLIREGRQIEFQLPERLLAQLAKFHGQGGQLIAEDRRNRSPQDDRSGCGKMGVEGMNRVIRTF